MEILELGDKLDGIWDTFFFPIIEFLILIISVLYIFGKDPFIKIKEKIIISYDGMLFWKRKGLYIPMRKTSYESIKKDSKTMFWLIIALGLIGVYALDKIIFGVSNILPFVYYYSKSDLLRFSVDDNTLALIWQSTPETPFYNLLDYIDSQVPSDFQIINYGDLIGILCFSKFMTVLLFVMLFIPCRNKKKQLLRCLSIFLIFVLIVFITHLFIFNEIVDNTQQKCYYLIKNIEINENNSVYENSDYIKCYEKLKQLREEDDLYPKKVFGFTFRNSGKFFDLFNVIELYK